jgi:transposase, IS5 family
MLVPKTNSSQLGFYSSFEEQLNRSHPLYILANTINWSLFEESFSKHYSADMGRPAKSIRLMTGLIILKHIRNVSDESVVEQWAENVYYQYFCGETHFANGQPCDATELIHFRYRIGVEGMELIFKESIRVNGKDGEDPNVVSDTTVQEKNITFPTDEKLYRKVVAHSLKIAKEEGIPLRQTYTRTVKKLRYRLRFKRTKQQKKLAAKALRKLKTIAGRLVRELERKLPPPLLEHYGEKLFIFNRVLEQSRHEGNKIYSIHEPHTQCISKGKEHKKYEFGSKVSIIRTQSGVIVGALNRRKNEYDGKTLSPALEQSERLRGIEAKEAIVDLGYRGVKRIGNTEVGCSWNWLSKIRF